jgi:hypothetical protein
MTTPLKLDCTLQNVWSSRALLFPQRDIFRHKTLLLSDHTALSANRLDLSRIASSTLWFLSQATKTCRLMIFQKAWNRHARTLYRHLRSKHARSSPLAIATKAILTLTPSIQNRELKVCPKPPSHSCPRKQIFMTETRPQSGLRGVRG